MADTMLQYYKVWVNLCVYTPKPNSTLLSCPPYLMGDTKLQYYKVWVNLCMYTPKPNSTLLHHVRPTSKRPITHDKLSFSLIQVNSRKTKLLS